MIAVAVSDVLADSTDDDAARADSIVDAVNE